MGPAGAQPVNSFDMVQVKPGRVQEYLELFRKYDKPVLEKLLADGTIYGYYFTTEAIHTTKPGKVWVSVVMPGLGTMDAVRAAYVEANKKLPEAESKLLERLYFDLTEEGTHRDGLSMSLTFRSK